MFLGKEVVDHATEEHVIECVDPDGGEEDEEFFGEIETEADLMLGCDTAKGETGCFPCTGLDDDPAEFHAVMDCLDDVAGCADAEEDGEDDGGGDGGRVEPDGAAVVDGDLIVFSESRGDA